MRKLSSMTTPRAALVFAACAAFLPGQTISSSAGNTTWRTPYDVAIDAAGNQYVTERGNDVIYRVDRLGATATIAGTGTQGFSGDGGPAASARLNQPFGIAVDAAGDIYFADAGNHRIRRIRNGIITTFAGTGRAGFSGDNGPASAAQINAPADLLLDPAGNLIFVDSGNERIRRVAPDGAIATIAGTGRRGFAGDGGPALLADIDPGWLALDRDGNLFFTNDGTALGLTGGNRRVRRIDRDQIVATVAGSGASGDNGDGGPATAAGFGRISGIAVDSMNNLFIASFSGDRIRRVGPDGTVTTYAGIGQAGFAGDDGPAISARLNAPAGIALDAGGNLYIADSNNRRIRKVTPPAPPAIRSETAGVPAFLGKTGFSSNMYLEIFGSNLANSTRTWTGADFNGANAPTELDGVRVTVNGKPAFIFFISPGQININAPEDDAAGPVQIQVFRDGVASNIGMADRSRVSPTLHTAAPFLVGDSQHVVAQAADFRSFVGRPGMIQGLNFRPARPGETVIVFALGCGPTDPPTKAGAVNPQLARLALPFELHIGGVTADVGFAGMLGNTIGLYQINAVIPPLPPGEHSIELVVDGVRNAQNLVIQVGE
ncbi:MAG: hypothetical protein R2762_21805 [Bryobacteraceae bacterium]